MIQKPTGIFTLLSRITGKVQKILSSFHQSAAATNQNTDIILEKVHKIKDDDRNFLCKFFQIKIFADNLLKTTFLRQIFLKHIYKAK